MCPIGPDSWCRFRKAEAADTSYLHTNSIPEACMEVVKPCFDKLATVENVRALQHDFSTDHNEAFNSTIWAVDGKSTFSSQPAVQFAADLATLRHNLGWEETSKRIYSEMKLDLPKERILLDRKQDECRRVRFEKRAVIRKQKSKLGQDRANEEHDAVQRLLSEQKKTAHKKRKPVKKVKKQKNDPEAYVAGSH